MKKTKKKSLKNPVSEPPKRSLLCGCLYHIALQQKLSEIKGCCSEIFTVSEAMVKRCIKREVPPAWVKTAWINYSISKSISRMVRGIKLLEWWPEEIVGPVRVHLSKNTSGGNGTVFVWGGKGLPGVWGVPWWHGNVPRGCKNWFCDVPLGS